MLLHIDDINTWQTEVIDSEKPVIVDFFATWCGPCKMLGPVLEQIADERDDLTVAKVDVDQQALLANQFRIQVVPTVMLFEKGEPTRVVKGYRNKQDLLAEFGL